MCAYNSWKSILRDFWAMAQFGTAELLNLQEPVCAHNPGPCSEPLPLGQSMVGHASELELSFTQLQRYVTEALPSAVHA